LFNSIYHYLFDEYRLIQTEFSNSLPDKRNFDMAIKELEEAEISYKIITTSHWKQYLIKLYVLYSVVMDLILILTVLFALFNLDRLIEIFKG
tara:strand:+ start:669 stop:944 length:276 start_codon:yes stop_codon:yes gene_type:complete